MWFMQVLFDFTMFFHLPRYFQNNCIFVMHFRLKLEKFWISSEVWSRPACSNILQYDIYIHMQVIFYVFLCLLYIHIHIRIYTLYIHYIYIYACIQMYILVAMVSGSNEKGWKGPCRSGAGQRELQMLASLVFVVWSEERCHCSQLSPFLQLLSFQSQVGSETCNDAIWCNDVHWRKRFKLVTYRHT